jgi:hypothetical protein
MPIMGPVPRMGSDLFVLLVLELGSELLPVEAAEEESVEVGSGVPLDVPVRVVPCVFVGGVVVADVGELPPT